MNKQTFEYMKLNEDDILEILLEHYQEEHFKNIVITRGIILGTPGKDLRFVGVFGTEDDKTICKCDLVELDKSTPFNGYHIFLIENPRFQL